MSETNRSVFYNHFVCIEGCSTSVVDLIIYASCLCYFIGKAGKDKFGTCTILMLLVPLLQYVLCSITRLYDYIKDYSSHTANEGECSIYFFRSPVDWIQESSMIFTGIII